MPSFRPHFADQRVTLWMLDRFHSEVHIKLGPVQMTRMRKLHIQQFSDGNIPEPGKLLKRQEKFPPPSSSQNPCFEMLVTSTSEMSFPGCADFTFVLLDQAACSAQLPHRQTVAGSAKFGFLELGGSFDQESRRVSETRNSALPAALQEPTVNKALTVAANSIMSEPTTP
jgi:hypothetical protein